MPISKEKNTHLIILDPIEKLNLILDSSLKIARELLKLGESVYITHSHDLFHKSKESGPMAKASQIFFEGASLSPSIAEKKVLPLNSFAAIHVRKDPPVDLDYFSMAWILESVDSRCKIFNAPKALLTLNEKLSLFRFPEDSIPSLLSADSLEILAFIQDFCHKKAVLKPLDLYGGRGVTSLDLSIETKESATQKVLELTEHNKRHRIIQPFLKEIFEGEVRAFTVGGQPLAWCLKKPKKGSFMANTAAGAELFPFSPNAELVARVQRVAQALLAEGVFYVGFDLIDGKISEINITSPRLLQSRDDSTNYYERVAQEIINNVRGTSCAVSP